MAVIDIVVFAVGFAGAWFGKDYILKWVQGAETFIKNLEAKVATLKAKAAAVNAAVKS